MIIAVDIDEVCPIHYSLPPSSPSSNPSILPLTISNPTFPSFPKKTQVLSCFTERLVQFFNANASTFPFATTSHLTVSTFNSYRFCEVWGGTDAESLLVVEPFLRSPHFTSGLPLVAGAVAGVQALKAAGHELHVVTSRQHFLEDATRAWLEERFGKGCFESVRFGNHWGTEGRKVGKPELCRSIGARVIIDDSIDYCRGCAEDGMEAVLFGHYAWNKTEDADLPEGVVRCGSWTEVCKRIAELAEE